MAKEKERGGGGYSVARGMLAYKLESVNLIDFKMI